MEHVVFFPAHDGTPAFRRVSSLEDAVRLVEHLRNVENVAELSVHSLTEVPLAFKAFYRVEVPADGAPEDAPVPSLEQPPPLPTVADPVANTVSDTVAVPTVVADAVAVPVVQAVPAVEAPVEAPVDAVPVPALASSNGHAEDAPSSLGFFAS
jgi:hypothetical protein